MLRVSFGNVIAIILPGGFALTGLRHFMPSVATLLENPSELGFSGGAYLLFVAAIAGGVIEGFRRVTADEASARRSGRDATSTQDAPSIFYYLDGESLPVFQAGVEDSYRWYTFYANLAIAVVSVVLMQLYTGTQTPETIFLVFVAMVAAYAAEVQHRYFGAFIRDFARRRRDDLDRKKESKDA